MLEVARVGVEGGVLVVAATERHDGSFHPERVDAVCLGERQAALTGVPWTMVDEVHGVDVVDVEVVDVDGEVAWQPMVGVGDVVLARRPARPIAVWTADCAPLILADDDATLIAGVHAGWRGLATGVIDAAVDAFDTRGSRVAHAVLGPSIRSCCYEFGTADLAAVAAAVGVDPGALAARTSTGTAGLDMPTAVGFALARRGIDVDTDVACTGCDERWYSHRMRGDAGRHATVAWVER